MKKIPAYILAGGQSSRFGEDKALAMIAGQPMITYVAGQWAGFASPVTVVAERARKYDAYGLRTIADNTPGMGPLGGLLASLDDCRTGWLLLCACDAIVVDATMPERLFAAVSEKYQVIALKGEHWETMPALYHVSILPIVKEAIACGQGALWRVIEKVRSLSIDIPADRPALAQVNTKEQLQALQERITGRPGP